MDYDGWQLIVSIKPFPHSQVMTIFSIPIQQDARGLKMPSLEKPQPTFGRIKQSFFSPNYICNELHMPINQTSPLL